MSPLLESIYRVIAVLHFSVGTIALLTFWLAAVARKRRGLHTQVGRVYVWAMQAIVVTGVPLALAAFLRGKPVLGTFLIYLAVLVTATITIAPRAVRLKHDYAAYRGGVFPWLAGALVLATLMTLITGLIAGTSLLVGFSIAGTLASTGMIATLRRCNAAPGWWLREHFGAMIGNGVGTHIAFLSIGLNRLLEGHHALLNPMLAWYGPLAIGVAIRVVLEVRHRRRYGRCTPTNAALAAG